MFTCTITPRFGDVDGLRHINNCLLPQWFEVGRGDLFRLFHPDLSLEDWKLIMASIRVDFCGQMRLGADVEIRTWVKKIGRSSFTAYQEAWQDGQLGAWGEAVIVHYHVPEGPSITIPDSIRSQLERHLLPEGAGQSSRRKTTV